MGARDIKAKRVWIDFSRFEITFEFKNQEPVRVKVFYESDLDKLLRTDTKEKEKKT